MSLKHFEAEVEAVRAKAASAQDSIGRERQSIDRDPNLSAEGKKAQLEQMKIVAKSRMDMLRAEETRLASEKRAELERKVFGTVGADPASVINYRDAQDRAEKIETSDDAEKLIKRAISSGDKTLALAVAQVAFERRYQRAYNEFASTNADVAEAASDLMELDDYQTNGGFHKTMAYFV